MVSNDNEESTLRSIMAHKTDEDRTMRCDPSVVHYNLAFSVDKRLNIVSYCIRIKGIDLRS